MNGESKKNTAASLISTPSHLYYIRSYLSTFTGELLRIAKTAVVGTSVMFAQLCRAAVGQDVVTLLEPDHGLFLK